MRDNKAAPVPRITKAFEVMMKRVFAYSFRKILLSPDMKYEPTARIRHYDKQCEAVEMISHVLKTRINQRKLESFMQLKTQSVRRFNRSNSKRARSSNDRKIIQGKQSESVLSLAWNRTASTIKSYTSNKKSEISEIFSRVKHIASDLLGQNSRKGLANNKNVQVVKPGYEILGKISELESNLQLLMHKKRQKERTPDVSTSGHRNARERQRYKNLQIEKLQIFI